MRYLKMKKTEHHQESSQSKNLRSIVFIVTLGLLSFGLLLIVIKNQLRVNELTAQLEHYNNTNNDLDFRNEKNRKVNDHLISSTASDSTQKITSPLNCNEKTFSTPNTLAEREIEQTKPITIDRQTIMEMANDVLVADHKPVLNDITTIDEIKTAFQFQAANPNLSITERLDALESMGEIFHEEQNHALVAEMLDAITTTNDSEDQIELLDSVAGMVTPDHTEFLIHLYGSGDATVSTLALLRLTELSDNDHTKAFLIEALSNDPKVTLDLLAAATRQ